MIVLVWSLVSGVVQYTRRRQLASALLQYLQSSNLRHAIICRRIRNEPSSEFAVKTNGTTRCSSEPHLVEDRALYRSEHAEVVVSRPELLIQSDWRYSTRVSLENDELLVSFMAKCRRRAVDDIATDSTQSSESTAIYLDSTCERVAWHRYEPWSIYTCTLLQFFDIVYAFTDNTLFENNLLAIVEQLQTVSISSFHSNRPHSSMSSSLTQLQRPLPLLEQLFRGDSESWQSLKERFGSEGALDRLELGSFASPTKRASSASRRRYRSCTTTARSSKDLGHVELLHELQSLRQINKEAILNAFANGTHISGAVLPFSLRSPLRIAMESSQSAQSSVGSCGVSPSITIDELGQQSPIDNRSEDGISPLPYADDSDVTTMSPTPVVDVSQCAVIKSNSNEYLPVKPPRSSVVVDSMKKSNGNGHCFLSNKPSEQQDAHETSESLVQLQNGPSNSTSANAALATATSDLCQTPASIVTELKTETRNDRDPIEQSNEALPQKSSQEKIDAVESTMTTSSMQISTVPEEAKNNNSYQNSSGATANHSKEAARPPSVANGVIPVVTTTFESPRSHNRKSFTLVRTKDEQVVDSSRRRHSTMDNVLRHRSLSPLPPVAIGGFTTRSFYSSKDGTSPFHSPNSSLRRPYITTRKFNSCKDRSQRAMFKPPSILVYAGGNDHLYERIRQQLRFVIPPDRFTVFNISSEAIKKQPWIEQTTSCLVIADMHGLDDVAWNKMQTFFNQAGKIVFVCQNRLLASLSCCESSKQQSDILRLAFGGKGSSAMGKDFQQFLKKSLKTLTKHGQVNEKFHTKDLTAGLSYSVVLSKNVDSPLLLYMENSAHQASAIFSDATSEQLVSPGSRVLADALSRVGVPIVDVRPPDLTTGYLVAEKDSILDSAMRYGDEIGLRPRLFLRKSQKVVTDGLPPATDELLPIEVAERSSVKAVMFDFERYFARLRTNALGKVVIHVPVATTTMDVSASFSDAVPTCESSLVIASQQIRGKGRGGNEFVSPVGAAMFTFSTLLSRSSQLGKNPSFAQHVFAVALVDAVSELSEVEDFPLKIKWPNDFYMNRSHKVGGMLATCRVRDDCLQLSIGCGINVTNSSPTVCLNDMLPEGSEKKFTIEEVVAEALNKFEHWMMCYEMKGQEVLLRKYYEFWLHSREEVLLEEIGEKVVIRGLDKYGYLQVRRKDKPSQLISVGDDGNTFDMMKGLIRHKV